MARIYIESDDELPELAEILRPKQSKSTATRSPSKPVRKTTKKDGASAKEESTSSRPKQRALRKVENNTKLLDPFNGGIAVKELKPSSRTNSRLSPQKPKKVIEPLEIEVEICEEEEDVICASADDSDFQSNGSLLDDEQDEKPSSFKPRSIPQSPLQKFMDARPKEKAKPNASSTLPPPSNPSYDLSNPFLGPRIALPALSSQPTTYSSRPTSSSPAFYNDAVLTYEPAKRLSPSKIMLPSKSPSRPSTPPAAPPSPSKKLNSPSKSRFAAIPKAPVHESIDAFWSQDVINDWNEQYSPKKIMTSPRKKRFATPPLSGEEGEDPPSPSTSPRKGIPRKVGMSPEKRMARDAKRSFEATKHEIAGRFLRELDDTISEGQIAKLSESTGGIRIDWSNRLLSTAGRANWRKECIKKQLPNGTVEKTYKHTAYIELATKVIDNEERLINVLAHEFCHLCTFMISEVRNNPHGKEFKSWYVFLICKKSSFTKISKGKKVLPSIRRPKRRSNHKALVRNRTPSSGSV